MSRQSVIIEFGSDTTHLINCHYILSSTSFLADVALPALSACLFPLIECATHITPSLCWLIVQCQLLVPNHCVILYLIPIPIPIPIPFHNPYLDTSSTSVLGDVASSRHHVQLHIRPNRNVTDNYNQPLCAIVHYSYSNFILKILNQSCMAHILFWKNARIVLASCYIRIATSVHLCTSDNRFKAPIPTTPAQLGSAQVGLQLACVTYTSKSGRPAIKLLLLHYRYS